MSDVDTNMFSATDDAFGISVRQSHCNALFRSFSVADKSS